MPDLLSPSEKARYEELGYLGPFTVISEDDMAVIRDRLDAEVLAPYLDMRESSSVAAKSDGPEGQEGERSG